MLLVCSLCASQSTYFKKYTSGSIVENNKTVASWKSSPLTIAFYGSPSNNIVFYYQNGSTKKYHQLTSGDNIKGFDSKDYRIIICNDVELNEQVAIQLYDNDIAIRLILPNGWIEFKK